MVTIQTLQHDLTIIAEEFISNHSFIQSFPEGQTANKKEIGRSGGHVLIKAKTAKGKNFYFLKKNHAKITQKIN